MTKTAGRPGLALPAVEDITRRDFLVGGAAALLLGGCGGSGGGGESSGEMRTVEHAMGTTEVPMRPRRLVALHDLAIFDPLVQLGFEPVAVADVDGLLRRVSRKGAEDVERVGTVAEPNLERIAALEPDLIVGDRALHEGIYGDLSEIAPTVMIDQGRPVGGPLVHQSFLADLVGRTERFEEMVAAYEERAASLQERLAPLAEELEASVIYPYSEGIFVDRRPQIPWVKAFSDLGIRQSAAMREYPPDDYADVSFERTASFDADAIFVQIDEYVEEADVEKFLSSPLLKSTFAYRTGQVFEVAFSPWSFGSVASLRTVLDDVERYLLQREIDASGDFR